MESFEMDVSFALRAIISRRNRKHDDANSPWWGFPSVATPRKAAQKTLRSKYVATLPSDVVTQLEAVYSRDYALFYGTSSPYPLHPLHND